MQISGRETSECIKVFKDINDLKDTPHNNLSTNSEEFIA